MNQTRDEVIAELLADFQNFIGEVNHYTVSSWLSSQIGAKESEAISYGPPNKWWTLQPADIYYCDHPGACRLGPGDRCLGAVEVDDEY